MRTHAAVTSVLILTLALILGCQNARGQNASTTPTRDEVAPPMDPGWPRQFSKDGDTVLVYQPQVDDWKDYQVIHYRAAIELVLKGAAASRFGVLCVEAQTQTDPATRTVVMHEEKAEVRFPNVPEAEEAKLAALVKESLPHRRSLTISLDRVLAYIKDTAGTQRSVTVSMEPPAVFRSEKPAILVMFMGTPAFQPVANTKLMFATNTNWDVFLDTPSNLYYLLHGSTWLTAPDAVKGPWVAAQALPQDLTKLPANDPNWDDVRKALPGVPAAEVPTVFVSTAPAELIVTKGKPQFSPIAGTALMYVSNTDSPLFLHTREQNFYHLVAGRWFRSKSLDGPWKSATNDLPADFSRIPDDSPMDYVSASVPGTQDAQDAVLVASIPQRATVSRKDLTVTVSYEGPPKFVPIEGTTMFYATNTPHQVIRVDKTYYCCANGVWFVSDAPTGLWAVCTSVPQVIYTIPATSPVHNVTYVTVYSSTPDTVVVGYTSGYNGAYIASGVVMFGAGVVTGAIIANNYHHNSCYYSYGCGAVYHGAYGGYYRAATVYGPYGGVGRAAAYNPATGAWARGAYAYGPNGGAFARQAYNPQTGVYRGQVGGTNPYGAWSRGVVSKGDDWIAGGRNANARGTVGWAETSGGRSAVGVKGNYGGAAVAGNQGGAAIRTGSGDIYAGKDGNIYKRQDGQWSKNDGSGWTTPARPSPTASPTAAQTSTRLDRDFRARSAGDMSTTRSSVRATRGGRGGRGR